MSRMTRYEPGQFSWIDLLTPDAEASRRFYCELFGWTTIDNPTDQGGVYTQFYCGEDTVAGMGEMSPEMQAMGMPPIWASYVTVEDCDKSVARAQELGASVDMPAMQVMTVGRMAILADPTGARFSLWQPGDHIGAGLVNEPCSLAWNELLTRDVDGAREFYAALFGWQYEVSPDADNPYVEIRNAGRSNGGILAMGDEFPDEVPPHWGAYVSVADCDQTLERVTALGGSVEMGPIDIEPGRFAGISDPLGGRLTVIKLHDPE